MTGWPVVPEITGLAARAIAFPTVTAPEVVLGSTQRVPAEVEARHDVRRRRSGGGAVWLAPGAQVWVDVALPRGDELWDEDVGCAFLWLGDAFGRAMAAMGVADSVVHRRRLVRSRWSDQVCFAGLGPGEVTVGAGGPKVVGMAQRRTREGALFQCAVPLLWDPAPLVDVLQLPPEAAVELADVAAAVAAASGLIEAALLAALP